MNFYMRSLSKVSPFPVLLIPTLAFLQAASDTVDKFIIKVTEKLSNLW